MRQQALVFHLLISDYFYQRLPAAGNRNGQDVNNVQNNGNYWSSTANNSNNAYHLNFNDNNLNPQNNNNRNNGYSVRLVQDFTQLTIDFPAPVKEEAVTYPSCRGKGESLPFERQGDSLLSDLFRAYYDARRHKRKTHPQLEFELDLEHNLITLYEELFSILESDIDILFAKICHDTYGAVDPPASAIVFREHYLCTNLQCECLVGHFGSYLCLSGADGLVGF